MPRTLVIGFGNIDRADDGAAFTVINTLRRRLGRPPLGEGETGWEETGGDLDTVFLHQLTPETAESLVAYRRIVFVDAHVLENAPEIHTFPVTPDFEPAAFTHHLTPAMMLGLLKALYGAEPEGRVVSIRGYDFDFRRGLSPRTGELAAKAAELILGLVENPVQG